MKTTMYAMRLALPLLLCVLAAGVARADDEPFKRGEDALPGSLQKKISVTFEDVDVKQALAFIARTTDTNILLGEGVAGRVSLKLVDVSAGHALRAIARTLGLDVHVTGHGVVSLRKSAHASVDAEEPEDEEIVEEEEREEIARGHADVDLLLLDIRDLLGKDVDVLDLIRDNSPDVQITEKKRGTLVLRGSKSELAAARALLDDLRQRRAAEAGVAEKRKQADVAARLQVLVTRVGALKARLVEARTHEDEPAIDRTRRALEEARKAIEQARQHAAAERHFEIKRLRWMPKGEFVVELPAEGKHVEGRIVDKDGRPIDLEPAFKARLVRGKRGEVYFVEKGSRPINLNEWAKGRLGELRIVDKGGRPINLNQLAKAKLDELRIIDKGGRPINLNQLAKAKLDELHIVDKGGRSIVKLGFKEKLVPGSTFHKGARSIRVGKLAKEKRLEGRIVDKGGRPIRVEPRVTKDRRRVEWHTPKPGEAFTEFKFLRRAQGAQASQQLERLRAAKRALMAAGMPHEAEQVEHRIAALEREQERKQGERHEGGGDVVREVRALREEVRGLRAELRTLMTLVKKQMHRERAEAHERR